MQIIKTLCLSHLARTTDFVKHFTPYTPSTKLSVLHGLYCTVVIQATAYRIISH